MKIFFLALLISFFFSSSSAQQLNQIHVLVPADNGKRSSKTPIMVNDHRLIMRRGSFAAVAVYDDSARLSFSEPGWKTQKGATQFLLDKDIFIVAYYDRTSTGQNKHFFRQVTLENYNRLKSGCHKFIRPVY